MNIVLDVSGIVDIVPISQIYVQKSAIKYSDHRGPDRISGRPQDNARTVDI